MGDGTADSAMPGVAVACRVAVISGVSEFCGVAVACGVAVTSGVMEMADVAVASGVMFVSGVVVISCEFIFHPRT